METPLYQACWNDNEVYRDLAWNPMQKGMLLNGSLPPNPKI